jgi:2-hydroxychromene-2-carboxylate isomerase
MTRSVEFWFDVGSPYAYLAWRALPTLAAAKGATIDWRPMLLGGVLKAAGNNSPLDVPAKRRWMLTDMQRWAQRIGTTIRPNPHFPVNTLAMMRAAVAMQMQGEDRLLRYLDAVYPAMWVDARDMQDPAVVAAVLRGAGFDPPEVLALAGEPAAKERLRANTDEAVARGVFGAPTFFVGDQMFWGQDRLEFVALALEV